VAYGEHVNAAFLKAFYGAPKRSRRRPAPPRLIAIITVAAAEERRHAFAFQMYMLTTRLFQMQEAVRLAHEGKRTAVLDRSAVGDAVFAIQNHKVGHRSVLDLVICM
jgi:deoxyadenosine/deoxycytidine kinase